MISSFQHNKTKRAIVMALAMGHPRLLLRFDDPVVVSFSGGRLSPHGLSREVTEVVSMLNPFEQAVRNAIHEAHEHGRGSFGVDDHAHVLEMRAENTKGVGGELDYDYIDQQMTLAQHSVLLVNHIENLHPLATEYLTRCLKLSRRQGSYRLTRGYFSIQGRRQCRFVLGVVYGHLTTTAQKLLGDLFHYSVYVAAADNKEEEPINLEDMRYVAARCRKAANPQNAVLAHYNLSDKDLNDYLNPWRQR